MLRVAGRDLVMETGRTGGSRSLPPATMMTPFSNVLALAQAPGFVLSSATAPDISTRFLAAVRSLADFSEAPDGEFETLFAVFAHAVSLNNLTRAEAEDFLSDYSLISRRYRVEFFERACTRLRRIARVAQTYADEVRSRPVPSDADEREDHEMRVAEAEADALRAQEELAAGEAQITRAEADRTPLFFLSSRASLANARTGVVVAERGAYHPRMFRVLVDAAKVSRPPAQAAPGPKLTIRVPPKPSASTAAPAPPPKPLPPAPAPPQPVPSVFAPKVKPSAPAIKPTPRMSTSAVRKPPAPRKETTPVVVPDEDDEEDADVDELDGSGSEFVEAPDDPKGKAAAGKKRGTKPTPDEIYRSLVECPALARQRAAYERSHVLISWDEGSPVSRSFSSSPDSAYPCSSDAPQCDQCWRKGQACVPSKDRGRAMCDGCRRAHNKCTHWGRNALGEVKDGQSRSVPAALFNGKGYSFASNVTEAERPWLEAVIRAIEACGAANQLTTSDLAGLLDRVRKVWNIKVKDKKTKVETPVAVQFSPRVAAPTQYLYDPASLPTFDPRFFPAVTTLPGARLLPAPTATVEEVPDAPAVPAPSISTRRSTRQTAQQAVAGPSTASPAVSKSLRPRPVVQATRVVTAVKRRHEDSMSASPAPPKRPRGVRSPIDVDAPSPIDVDAPEPAGAAKGTHGESPAGSRDSTPAFPRASTARQGRKVSQLERLLASATDAAEKVDKELPGVARLRARKTPAVSNDEVSPVAAEPDPLESNDANFVADGVEYYPDGNPVALLPRPAIAGVTAVGTPPCPLAPPEHGPRDVVDRLGQLNEFGIFLDGIRTQWAHACVREFLARAQQEQLQRREERLTHLPFGHFSNATHGPLHIERTREIMQAMASESVERLFEVYPEVQTWAEDPSILRARAAPIPERTEAREHEGAVPEANTEAAREPLEDDHDETADAVDDETADEVDDAVVDAPEGAAVDAPEDAVVDENVGDAE